MILTKAHQQLFARRPDERFTSLQSLYDRCVNDRQSSRDCWTTTLQAVPMPADAAVSLAIEGGETFRPNDWSFGQLCKLANVAKETVIRVAVAFQDINGLRASYGDSAAVEFPNLCANKAFCKTTSGETADWISSFNIGSAEVVEYQKSYRQDQPDEVNISEQVAERFAVRKEELMNLPQARNGIVPAYIKADGIGTLKCTIDYFGRTPPLKKKDPQLESLDFIRRDDEDQRLLPWNDEDLKRLGLKKELLERRAKRPPEGVSDAGDDDGDDNDDDGDLGRYAVRHL